MPIETLGPILPQPNPEQSPRPVDTLLSLRGTAKHLFKEQSGDEFLAEEREGWDIPEERTWAGPSTPEVIWERIKELEGETFYTATNLPFTYKMDGNGWWPYRDGQLIKRKATYAHFLRGLERCPIKTTTEIADLFNPSYWFGVLMDKRIRRTDW